MDIERAIISKTKLWIERFVISLSLCPFAAYSFNENMITYSVSTSLNVRASLEDCANAIFNLKNDQAFSNSFIIFNESLDFDGLLQLKDTLEIFMEEVELIDFFQTVAFHPEFRFEGENIHSYGNYINRSPYPMIHILRRKEVSKAIQSVEDVHEIPYRNVKILDELKLSHIDDIFTTEFEQKIEAMMKKYPSCTFKN